MYRPPRPVQIPADLILPDVLSRRTAREIAHNETGEAVAIVLLSLSDISEGEPNELLRPTLFGSKSEERVYGEGQLVFAAAVKDSAVGVIGADLRPQQQI